MIFTEYEAKEIAQRKSEVNTGDFVACALNDKEWVVARFYNPHTPHRQYVYNNGVLRYSA